MSVLSYVFTLFAILPGVFHTLVISQAMDCEAMVSDYCQGKLEASAQTKKELISCIFNLQNAAFLLDEQACEYDSARLKAQNAFKAWQCLNDTLNQANMLKYLGYLNGRLKNFDTAKNQIQKAIHLYTSQKAEFGIMVSTFDLAKVYEYEGFVDTATILTLKAREYWKINGNDDRVFGLNNYLIYLSNLNGNQIEAGQYIEENRTILFYQNLYWQNQMDYYYLTGKYYKNKDALKHQESINRYKELKEVAVKDFNEYKFSLFDPENCK